MHTKEIISYLSVKVGREHSSSTWRDVARITGGVPVYQDMGGMLFLAGDGDVFGYDVEQGGWAPVTDGWRGVALRHAARLYQELAHLVPRRPLAAPDCGACAGAGMLLGAECARCFGAGWITSPPGSIG
jgi:hypothetical protein